MEYIVLIISIKAMLQEIATCERCLLCEERYCQWSGRSMDQHRRCWRRFGGVLTRHCDTRGPDRLAQALSALVGLCIDHVVRSGLRELDSSANRQKHSETLDWSAKFIAKPRARNHFCSPGVLRRLPLPDACTLVKLELHHSPSIRFVPSCLPNLHATKDIGFNLEWSSRH